MRALAAPSGRGQHRLSSDQGVLRVRAILTMSLSVTMGIPVVLVTPVILSFSGRGIASIPKP